MPQTNNNLFATEGDLAQYLEMGLEIVRELSNG
jgi:hypothetical protein